jgi:hypothetical protein
LNTKTVPHKQTVTPEKCGTCHKEIFEEYKKSVHGKDFQSGVKEAPACKDCHGEHNIKLINDPTSNVFYKNVPKTCTNCHEDQALIKKFHLPARPLKSYVESFHGIATKYGKITAANCVSCHGYHDIQVSTDPSSRINPGNLVKTCGACHPDAKKYVMVGPIHSSPNVEAGRISLLTKNIYGWIIGILLLCFLAYLAHNLSGKIRRRRSQRYLRKKEM